MLTIAGGIILAVILLPFVLAGLVAILGAAVTVPLAIITAMVELVADILKSLWKLWRFLHRSFYTICPKKWTTGQNGHPNSNNNIKNSQ